MAAADEHYINNFFAQYDSFDYDPAEPFLKEFNRLARQQKWNRYQREEARAELKDAMVHQFNKMYGRNEEDLESWQLLCNALGANPIPDTIAECRKLLRRTHVNLVDFIEVPKPGQHVRVFKSEFQLSKYTQEHRKYFPRENVNAGSLLRCLLRNIKNPSGRRGKEGKGREEKRGQSPEGGSAAA